MLQPVVVRPGASKASLWLRYNSTGRCWTAASIYWWQAQHMKLAKSKVGRVCAARVIMSLLSLTFLALPFSHSVIFLPPEEPLHHLVILVRQSCSEENSFTVWMIEEKLRQQFQGRKKIPTSDFCRSNSIVQICGGRSSTYACEVQSVNAALFGTVVVHPGLQCKLHDTNAHRKSTFDVNLQWLRRHSPGKAESMCMIVKGTDNLKFHEHMCVYGIYLSNVAIAGHMSNESVCNERPQLVTVQMCTVRYFGQTSSFGTEYDCLAPRCSWFILVTMHVSF